MEVTLYLRWKMGTGGGLQTKVLCRNGDIDQACERVIGAIHSMKDMGQTVFGDPVAQGDRIVVTLGEYVSVHDAGAVFIVAVAAISEQMIIT